MFCGYQQSKTYWTIELIQNSQWNDLVISFFRATDDPTSLHIQQTFSPTTYCARLTFPWFDHPSQLQCILFVIWLCQRPFALSKRKWPPNKMSWIDEFPAALLCTLWPASASHWRASAAPFQPCNNRAAGCFAPNIDLSSGVLMTQEVGEHSVINVIYHLFDFVTASADRAYEREPPTNQSACWRTRACGLHLPAGAWKQPALIHLASVAFLEKVCSLSSAYSLFFCVCKL